MPTMRQPKFRVPNPMGQPRPEIESTQDELGVPGVKDEVYPKVDLPGGERPGSEVDPIATLMAMLQQGRGGV